MGNRPAYTPPPIVSRKKNATMVKVLGPDSKEHEMSLANATDLVSNVPGWKWPPVPVEIVNPFAHAPRKKQPREQQYSAEQSDQAREVIKQKMREAGRYDDQERPHELSQPVLPTATQTPMGHAAALARASLERDNDGPTADQILGEKTVQEELAVLAAETEAAAAEKKKAATSTQKRQKPKSMEDDAEVVAKVTGSVAKESVTAKLKEELASKADHVS